METKKALPILTLSAAILGGTFAVPSVQAGGDYGQRYDGGRYYEYSPGPKITNVRVKQQKRVIKRVVTRKVYRTKRYVKRYRIYRCCTTCSYGGSMNSRYRYSRDYNDDDYNRNYYNDYDWNNDRDYNNDYYYEY